MQRNKWLRALRAELNRRRLSAFYVDRLVDELRDHAADLVKEDIMGNGASATTDISSRLGTVEAVADNAALQYRASWIARHPIIAFLIAPAPLVVTAWLVYMAIGAVVFLAILPTISSTLALDGKPVDEWVPRVIWFALMFHVGLKFVPPVIVTVIVCYLVHHSGQDWRWALVACGVVGVVAGLFCSTLELPVEPEAGRFSVGFGLPPSIDQVGQCLVPLLVGGFMIWRCWHLWRDASAAPANTA